MFQADIFRTATFRLTLAFVVTIMAGMLLQFGLVYAQMTSYEMQRSWDLLQREAALLVHETPQQLEYEVRERSKSDLRVILNGAAIFDMDHRLIAGDIKTWPQGLVVSDAPQRLWMTPSGDTPYEMRYIAVVIPGPADADNRILVLARSLHMADELRYIAKRAALFSVVPIVLFALLAGALLSHRALGRVKDMHEAIDLIMKGDLHERLPAGQERDDLERLAVSVNRMLDRLEHLLDEIRDVGNDIAHDLRTPLSRVRARLERATATPHDAEYLSDTIAKATADLDQCFSIITALLRIGEIENGRRRAGFAPMDLGALIADIADLYEPIAETEGISLTVRGVTQPIPLYGDIDLLNEVLANLIDNAIKFTPAGGSVTLTAGVTDDGSAWLEVADTGIGIPEEERDVVFGRFYRSDKSRHVPGSGLGLSLVSAIVRLHDGILQITSNVADAPFPGAILRLVFAPVSGDDTFVTTARK